MQYDFRLRFIKSSLQCIKITNISYYRMYILLNSGNLKQRRTSRRIEGIASNNSSSISQHLTQPRSLKTSMSCYKYFLSFIKTQIKVHDYFPQSFQSFHGAFPTAFQAFVFLLMYPYTAKSPCEHILRAAHLQPTS